MSRHRTRIGLWLGLSGAVLFLTAKLWFGVNAAPADVRSVALEQSALSTVCRGAGAVVHRADVMIDGDLGDWPSEWFAELAENEFVALEPGARAEGSARVAFAWNRDTLYVAIDVDDAAAFNPFSAADSWQGDSVQLALDMGGNGGLGYDGVDDYELGWALLRGAPTSHRFAAPAGALDEPGEVRIERTAGGLRYELAVPAASVGHVRFGPGTRFGLALVINDNDGDGRRGWFQTSDGVGFNKNPQAFTPVCLGR